MTNADKFKEIFGLYATELWAKPEKEFLEWLNEDVPETNVGGMISRQTAIDKLEPWLKVKGYSEGELNMFKAVLYEIRLLPSVQPEPLTDNEQRLFLAAMGREEKVCKQVEDDCRECKEPYEDSLVKICHEITRKVKGVLWT